MDNKSIIESKKKIHIQQYVRGLTEDLDDMAEKMRKKQLDVETYQEWFALITTALDLIKNKKT